MVLVKGHKIRNTGRTRFKKGYIPWNKGEKGIQPYHNLSGFPKKGEKRERTPEGDKSFREKMSGERNPRWRKEGRDQISLNEKRWKSRECAEWREKVLKRDDWKCKIRNKDCKGRLEAHHILTWRDFPELRFKINNGITLCRAHHPRKRAEEKRLGPYFQGLVPVSKELLF